MRVFLCVPVCLRGVLVCSCVVFLCVLVPSCFACVSLWILIKCYTNCKIRKSHFIFFYLDFSWLHFVELCSQLFWTLAFINPIRTRECCDNVNLVTTIYKLLTRKSEIWRFPFWISIKILKKYFFGTTCIVLSVASLLDNTTCWERINYGLLCGRYI